MRIFFFAVVFGTVAMFNAAHAQNNPVIVELYTSQGCSSCPPADALLNDLDKDPNVIALALHVDYWDYLGWKDTFSNNQYTLRQRAYARAAQKRTIYTPQMVVQGVNHVIGTHARDVKDYVAAHNKATKRIDVQISRAGNILTITAAPTGLSVGASVVQVVRYEPEQTVSIRRGENAGRKISYGNIVVDWQVVGKWNGRGTFRKNITVTGSLPIVVIIQKVKNGPILAAARWN